MANKKTAALKHMAPDIAAILAAGKANADLSGLPQRCFTWFVPGVGYVIDSVSKFSEFSRPEAVWHATVFPKFYFCTTFEDYALVRSLDAVAA